MIMTRFSIPSTMKAFVVHDETLPPPSETAPRRSLHDNGTLQTNYPVPDIPSPSYALLQILRAGICNTDLEILQGYMGFNGILGHEFVGRVVALHERAHDDVKEMWLLKRVCGDINLGCCNNTDNFASSSSSSTATSSSTSSLCGVCTDSLGYNSTHPQMSRNHCPNRTVLGILNQNGSFCEYMILPLRNLHIVPPQMKNEVAVFAEPLAAACRIVEQGLVNFRYHNKDYETNNKAMASRGGDRVAILGDGKLGLCVAEILGREYLRCCIRNNTTTDSTPPPPPILFGKHAHKLKLVEDSGVQTQLVSTCYTIDKSDDDNNNQESSQKCAVSPTYRNKFDVVIDATGNPNGLDLAMTLCRPMGKVILKSTCAAGVKGFHSAPIVIDELMVVGSRCGPIDVALDIMNKNGGNDGDGDDGVPPLSMEKYITNIFPLSRVQEALECAAMKSTLKVQLVMTEE